MIRYLIDSSAVWRLQREQELNEAWAVEIDAGSIGSCAPQRAEFRRSARSLDEFEQMTTTFEDLFPNVGIPKTLWAWVETAQFRLAARAQHRALSLVDLIICAVGAHHGLIILHDDRDFQTVADVSPDLRQRSIRAVGPPGSG